MTFTLPRHEDCVALGREHRVQSSSALPLAGAFDVHDKPPARRSPCLLRKLWRDDLGAPMYLSLGE
jgi:hypothetical protein